MNILFVFYIPSGGVETLNRQRAVALKNRGINCHFLYYQKKRELVNKHEGPVFISNNDIEIKKILNNGNFKAVIITSDYRALERFKKLGYKGKLIFEIQGLGTKEMAISELKKAIPLAISYGDGVLMSKTPHIIEILSNQVLPLPQFIFNNCFNASEFSYKKLPQSINPILMWIGRIESNKNWNEFLKIGHKLINEFDPNIKLYLFEDSSLSDPNERQRFQQTIKELKLKKSVHIFSNIPHEKMAEYFSLVGDSGGFLCSTSIIESFGYAIVEAMSCKCPVLSTKSDGVINSIIHNKTGKYYTLGNISEAFNEGKELLTNYELREHIRLTALNHIKKEFSPDLYGQQFIDMLKNLRIKI